MAEISSLTISVSANTDKATNNINALVNSLKRLKEAISSVTPQLSNFASSTKKIKPHLEGVKRSSNKASESFKKMRTETKNAGKEAKSSASGFSKLASAFKRIILYRAIRSIIKGISQGIREGVGNLYQWSKAMSSAGYGQFAKTMDSLATSFLYLKNSIGAMVSPLINALAPAINWIIDRFVDLFNVANQVISFLSGKSTWTKAKRVPTEFAEAANTASGAAKELRDVLADFDEINLIDPGKSGGGGGGSSSSLQYENMFEEVPFTSGTQTFLDKLHEKLEEYGITEKLEELKKAWDNLKQAWENFKNSKFFKVLERIVATVASDAMFQILQLTIDTLNLIAAVLNGDLIGILEGVGKTVLGTTIFGPLSAIAALIDGIFGTHIADWIHGVWDAISKFNLKKWLQDTWKAIQKMFPAFKKGGTFTKIGEEFKEIFGNMKKAFKDLGAGIKNAWEKVIKPVLSFLWDTLKKFFKWLKEKGVFDWLRGAVNSIVKIFISWAKTPFVTTLDAIVNGVKTLAAFLSGDMKGAINGLKDIASDFLIDIIQPFAETFDSIFGTDVAGWLKNLKTAIKDFDLGEWLEGIWKKVHKWINVDFISFFQASYEFVKIKIENLMKLAKGLWKGITEGKWDDYNAAANGIRLTFNDVLDTVKAKNLEIYNRAEMKAIKIDALTGKKPDKVMTRLIEMRDGVTNKSIKVQFKGDKNDAWDRESYALFKAASSGSSYTINVKIKTSLQNKLAPRDIFKDKYINFRIGNNTIAKAELYGHGGFVPSGDLFIANESSPEYVGSMNGKTAVANNEQIVEGVASGVFRAIVNTGIVDAVKNNKKGSAPVFAPSVEAGRWIQRSLNMYQTVG